MWPLSEIPIKAWIIVGVVAALTATAAWQYHRRVVVERDLAEFRLAYTHLAQVTDEQNKAIGDLQTEGVRRAQAAALALAQAHTEGEAWRKSADRLRGILAVPMAMTCDEAVDRAKDALP